MRKDPKKVTAPVNPEGSIPRIRLGVGYHTIQGTAPVSDIGPMIQRNEADAVDAPQPWPGPKGKVGRTLHLSGVPKAPVSSTDMPDVGTIGLNSSTRTKGYRTI